MTKKTQSLDPTMIDRLLPIGRVMDLTSFSKATIYRKVADGTLPAPLKIGTSRVAWRQSDIAAWMAQQAPATNIKSSTDLDAVA